MKKSEILKSEIALGHTKSTFVNLLVETLKLYQVSSPMFVNDNTGLNDDLNGVEKPVGFTAKNVLGNFSIIQSLAKWKRYRLKELEIEPGYGIVTDMHALRPDDVVDDIHSVYVDQWDWEKVISAEDRKLSYLKEIVGKIYQALRLTELCVSSKYEGITPVLPDKIKFIHTQELFDRYPEFTPKERENLIAKEFGAVFLIGIGAALSGGEPHDGRAPDYDDWTTFNEEGSCGLNGDIILWNPILERAFEVSSMGIRVDRKALLKQLDIRGCAERASLPYHRMLINGELPLTIGGGIGQSRVAMFMLRKKHICEVQHSVWPDSAQKVKSV